METGPVPGCPWRHPVPGRSGRTAAADAGEAAARDPGKIGARGRCAQRGTGGRADSLGHPPRPGGTGRRRALPPRPVLPHPRDRTEGAAAA
ncbi:hypothetical protein G6F31_020863 [Rhizopus arrhizus]|nr:hypothetical protein G6F31_020863 [Rhizopus arrhizus]